MGLYVVYMLGAVMRCWMIITDQRVDLLDRIEINTPLNSMKRVIESNYRLNANINPYSSDILHENPVNMKLYSLLINTTGDLLPYIFILIDILTAHALYLFCKRYMLYLFIEQETEKHSYASDAENQLVSGKHLHVPAVYVAAIYLFNPYTLLNCIAMATTAVNNMVLAGFFLGIVYQSGALCAITLALATVQSFYPIVLVAPFYLCMLKSKGSHFKAICSLMMFPIAVATLLFVAKHLHDGWEFLEHTFGFILQVSDQQPNVGVFWYFFMEMFEHFRLLFLFSYQMNVTILYFLPLAIKFRKDTPLLTACFVTLFTIFKSYPSIGDFGLTLSLLPCWKHLYNCMQQIFISSVAIVVSTALAPILWDLWIFWGTANANFFFGTTLIFITAHIFLVTDISFAYSKREYLLKYGNCRKINGKEAKLVLE